MKYLYYYCHEAGRKIELEEIVDPKKMPCKGEFHKKIPHQCSAIVRWTATPQYKNSGIYMRCRRMSLLGTTVCCVHGQTPPKRIREGTRMKAGARPKNKYEFFEKEIKEKIEAFKEDPDLEKLEFELGYLKSLLPRIESDDTISSLEKFKLIQKVLDSIFKNMETRERIIEQRRYSLGLEKVQLLMKYVFDAVKKHVHDPETLKKIGKEMQAIALKMRNVDEQRNEYIQDQNDLEDYAEELEKLPENTVKIASKKVKKVKKVKKAK